VIKKELNPRILATYETERRPVAEELIACDTFLLQMFDTDMAEVPVWMQEREIQILQLNMGFSIEYQDPLLTRPNPERTEVTTQKPDTIIPGRRFPHLTVLNHATAKTCSIQTLLKSDGRFHVVVFAGDISQPSELERLNSCGRTLRRLLARLPRSDMLNIILVHCAPRSSVELGSLDEAFFPVHDLLGWDYDRVHCDIELDYDAAGISRDCGVVLVRPDQHVSWCGELTDLGKLRCRLLIMGLPLRPE
jgi:phenol 2-monooxygenase